METTVKKSTASATSVAWKRTESKKQIYNADDVVDAYLVGKRDGFAHGMDDMQRAMVEMMRTNADKAAEYTKTILAALTKQNIGVQDAYLKLSSWNELSVLVLVPEDSFVQPSFKSIYNLVYDLEDDGEKQKLFLSFAFAPFGQNFNMSCMSGEGYLLQLTGAEAAA